MNLAVVKVGGSLYDDPRLGPGLRDYLDSIHADRILVVAGGGSFADAVRDLDHWHQLGEESAHYLALLGCHASMHFVRGLIGTDIFTTAVEWWKLDSNPRVTPLGCMLFLKQFENVYGPVPHSWDLTTDSIAALAARIANARLILLKSVDIPPGTPWAEAAERGWVDRYFLTAIGEPPVPVETLNFRGWLDQHFAAGTEV